jgi:hypothetical protein
MQINGEDRTISRLRELGTHPVDPDVAARHQGYMAAATPAAPSRSRMRPLLVGSMLAGALLGGTGLAAALPGSLPEQAGSVAKAALRAVQLADDEDDAATKAEKAKAKAERQAAKANGERGVARFTEGCTTGTPPVPFTGNHGQYVKAHPDDPATAGVNEREVAAASDCGKPLPSIGGTDTEANESRATGQDRADEAKAEAEARAQARTEAGTGQPADAGRPESPGNSEGTKPPVTAENQQGSENRATDRGNSEDAGSSAEMRPEGVGPPTSAP